MLHEIQDGDVVIVTMSAVSDIEEVHERIRDLGVNGITLLGFVEKHPSVHVIRAKKDKPNSPKTSDGWPAWRDVKVEKPEVGSNIVYFNNEGVVGVCHRVSMLGAERADWLTHWMPLPEGPK